MAHPLSHVCILWSSRVSVLFLFKGFYHTYNYVDDHGGHYHGHVTWIIYKRIGSPSQRSFILNLHVALIVESVSENIFENFGNVHVF